MRFADVETAEDIERLARVVYGSHLPTAGVLHPTAVWQTPEKALITLKIEPETPKSATDFFVLNLARARADAILTTGEILRSERDLRHELQGPEQVGEALVKWRHEVLGKTRPPISLVLTSGRNLDLDHPFFDSGRPLIFTSLEGEGRLREPARNRGIDLVGVERPSLWRAVAYLEASRGARVISNEAGPSSSLALYESPCRVEELLLSRLVAERIPTSSQGAAFLELSVIATWFDRRSVFRETTEDGTWFFERWTRRAAADPG